MYPTTIFLLVNLRRGQIRLMFPRKGVEKPAPVVEETPIAIHYGTVKMEE